MSTETTLSDAQQHELQTGLVTLLKQDVAAKEVFCKCWECAKAVLELLLKIPRIPAIVKTVIQAIIKAGDLAYATLCKK